MRDLIKLFSKWTNQAYPYLLTIDFGDNKERIIIIELSNTNHRVARKLSNELVEHANFDIISQAISMCKDEINFLEGIKETTDLCNTICCYEDCERCVEKYLKEV